LGDADDEFSGFFPRFWGEGGGSPGFRSMSFFLIKCSGLADSKRLPWMGTVRILLY
jgi:hypothetical protein